MMPQINIENRMLIDSEWNEIEYGVPDRGRLRNQRRNYDMEEMEEEE